MGRIDVRLAEIGIVLPEPAAPIASYVPFAGTQTTSGELIIISGQVTLGTEGLEYQGKLGAGISLEDGQAAARLCAINVLAQLKSACQGNLDRTRRCLRLGGFVNATPDFDQHPAVINGASDLMVEVFGEAGQHARAAVGVSSLPFNVAVELEAMFLID